MQELIEQLRSSDPATRRRADGCGLIAGEDWLH